MDHTFVAYSCWLLGLQAPLRFFMLCLSPVGQLTLLENVSISVLLAFFQPFRQKPSRQMKLLVIAVSLKRDMT